VDDVEGYFWLKQGLRALRVAIPIFADETAKTSHDVVKLAGAMDGVVVKIMKGGGIRESLRMIHTARAHDMQIMISCMIESSVGVTVAAHLGGKRGGEVHLLSCFRFNNKLEAQLLRKFRLSKRLSDEMHTGAR
jgi:L-alanine-DL-glutamate epimerase-like enolase superfamily enzyme